METLKPQTEVKAKKEHRCSFCNERIKSGETYIKSTHIFDGSVYDWKAHKMCDYLCTKMNMYADCDEGVTQDDFMEIISEAHYSILADSVSIEDRKKLDGIFHQLRRVNFKDKLDYVYRYYLKIDLNNKP